MEKLLPETEKVMCKYQFNEVEKQEIASEMAQNVAELNQAEDDKKAIMSDLKSKIDGISAHVNGAATKLNNGYEMRYIECEIDRGFKKKIITWKRVDSKEIAKTKNMTSDDIQMELEMK